MRLFLPQRGAFLTRRLPGVGPHELDTSLCKLTRETGEISIDLSVDDAGGPTWRDSLIDEAGAKITQVAEVHGSTSGAKASAGSGGPATLLAQAVESFGQVVKIVDNLSEVSKTKQTFVSRTLISCAAGPSLLQDRMDLIVQCVQGQ